jgi:hypothetical protein
MEPNIKYDENQPVYDIIDYERFTFQSGYVKCKQLVIIVNAICAVLTRAGNPASFFVLFHIRTS